MERAGEVISISGNMACVKFAREKSCKNCKACLSAGDGFAVVEIENKLNAHIGDSVQIQLHAKNVLNASLVAYGVPLVLLLLGVGIGSCFSDIMAALLGVLFCGCGFFVLKLLESRFKRMGTFKPHMIRVINK